jgi:hypothetical protein
MKVLALDPAGNSFGVAVIELTTEGKMYLPMTFVINAPSEWDISRKNSYMAHCCAALISLEKPDLIVSEKPWGQGFSKQSITELIGAIKAELWTDVEWQGVSEARRAVLGDGYGAADKKVSAEWLLSYPWMISAKNILKDLISKANPETKEGYDVLDAILHGLCYLVANGKIQQVSKPTKNNKKKKGNSNEIKS